MNFILLLVVSWRHILVLSRHISAPDLNCQEFDIKIIFKILTLHFRLDFRNPFQLDQAIFLKWVVSHLCSTSSSVQTKKKIWKGKSSIFFGDSNFFPDPFKVRINLFLNITSIQWKNLDWFEINCPPPLWGLRLFFLLPNSASTQLNFNSYWGWV